MSDTIELIQQDDHFIVRITENGKISDKTFDSPIFAASWAAGQSYRLGVAIPEIDTKAE
jgi:hypothetical protein